MSGGPKRNADRINTIGVVVVGICGAVLVYVSIIALEAFYSNDVANVQTMADYGGQDSVAKHLKSEQNRMLTELVPNTKPTDPTKPQTYHIDIADGMRLVVAEAKKDPANLIPSVGRSEKATIDNVFGRPKPLPTAVPSTGAGSAAPPVDGAGSGSGTPAAGSGSAVGTGTPVDPAMSPQTPHGH